MHDFKNGNYSEESKYQKLDTTEHFQASEMTQRKTLSQKRNRPIRTPRNNCQEVEMV